MHATGALLAYCIYVNSGNIILSAEVWVSIKVNLFTITFRLQDFHKISTPPLFSVSLIQSSIR